MRCAEGIRKIAWSYVFIYFHFNLGTIDILPDWWGYMLILKGIKILTEDEPSISLLEPLCGLCVGYNIITWAVKIVGITVDIYLWNLIYSVLLLYFNFQLLTNIADIARKYNCSEERRIRQLIIIRTVISAFLSIPLEWIKYEWVVYAAGITTLIIAIWTGILLFTLRDSLREGIDENVTEE